MNIGALEWVLKQLDTLQEQSVWHDVEKETPTSFGEGVIVLCKNKNKEDGIWLTDFIPCWEGEWKPRFMLLPQNHTLWRLVGIVSR